MPNNTNTNNRTTCNLHSHPTKLAPDLKRVPGPMMGRTGLFNSSRIKTLEVLLDPASSTELPLPILVPGLLVLLARANIRII